MENAESNVEIDSVVDFELEVREDPTDSVAELHAGTLDKGVDPILVGLGATEAMAVRGPRTDADACEAEAPVGGHAVQCFESNSRPA